MVSVSSAVNEGPAGVALRRQRMRSVAAPEVSGRHLNGGRIELITDREMCERPGLAQSEPRRSSSELAWLTSHLDIGLADDIAPSHGVGRDVLGKVLRAAKR